MSATVQLETLIAAVRGGTVGSAATAYPSRPPPRPPAAEAPKLAKRATAKVEKTAPEADALAPAKPAADTVTAPKTVAAASPKGSDVTPTEALYQKDTYLFASRARVLSVTEEAGKGWSVALDATCFHPQGGGQPADVGTITSIDGGAPFEVTMVRKGAGGVVLHEGPSQPPFAVGAAVECRVAEAPRRMNARVHSAGHLIDVAMGASGCALRPTKGYHFTPGAYVEYDGKLEASEREALLPKVQAALNALIGKAVPTVVRESEDGVRIVSVGGQDCPCGGTHVKDTAELGAVKLEAIKTKGKVTRVSYTLVD